MHLDKIAKMCQGSSLLGFVAKRHAEALHVLEAMLYVWFANVNEQAYAGYMGHLSGRELLGAG